MLAVSLRTSYALSMPSPGALCVCLELAVATSE
jgi:hypothetical protein